MSHETTKDKCGFTRRRSSESTKVLGGGRMRCLSFSFTKTHPAVLRDYQHFLEQRDIPFVTRVLRPRIETVLERQRVRGRPSDRDHESRHRHAEHQLKCLNSVMIHDDWVIDSSQETAEQTYSTHFMHFVEPCRAPGTK